MIKHFIIIGMYPLYTSSNLPDERVNGIKPRYNLYPSKFPLVGINFLVRLLRIRLHLSSDIYGMRLYSQIGNVYIEI